MPSSSASSLSRHVRGWPTEPRPPAAQSAAVHTPHRPPPARRGTQTEKNNQKPQKKDKKGQKEPHDRTHSPAAPGSGSIPWAWLPAAARAPPASPAAPRRRTLQYLHRSKAPKLQRSKPVCVCNRSEVVPYQTVHTGHAGHAGHAAPAPGRASCCVSAALARRSSRSSWNKTKKLPNKKLRSCWLT